MTNDIKPEIVSFLIVALFAMISNMAMMHFLGFDPFSVTFGSILGLVSGGMFEYLKHKEIA